MFPSFVTAVTTNPSSFVASEWTLPSVSSPREPMAFRGIRDHSHMRFADSFTQDMDFWRQRLSKEEGRAVASRGRPEVISRPKKSEKLRSAQKLMSPAACFGDSFAGRLFVSQLSGFDSDARFWIKVQGETKFRWRTTAGLRPRTIDLYDFVGILRFVSS